MSTKVSVLELLK